MKLWPLALPILALTSCRGCPPPGAADASVDASSGSIASVANLTATPTTVYVSFGANSKIGPADWPFCGDAGGCSFPLAVGGAQPLPSFGRALNVTLSFDQAPGCGVTLAELNLNIPGWSQDTANISLVNGQSNDVQIFVSGPSGDASLGPTVDGSNAGIFGVYPAGCDICVARQSPPCGIGPCGSSPNDGGQGCGCQAGSQYDPAVPCQYSFARGAVVNAQLVAH